MGGNAFSERLPTALFPRMSTAFYNSLKARLIPRLEALYHLVVVPPEAPGKVDHGDLDILVCHPKNVKEGIPRSECVTPEEIERALGSVYSIPLAGDRTSNFAIPIQQDEVHQFALDKEELDLGQLYIQIDLHFCEDEESLGSRTLFQSYGELGIILGMLGKTVGFTWSPSGLKLFHYKTYIADPPCVRLTCSQVRIFEFFGLSLNVHERGFTTAQEVFEWVASSRFFNPHRLLPAMESAKIKGERKMYKDYLDYLRSLIASEVPKKRLDVQAIQDEALTLFGKAEEFHGEVREKYLFREAKKVFSGSLVKEWTGLSYWKDVKIVTDEMRVRVLDGIETPNRDWREEMIKLNEEERKVLALRLKEELNLPGPVEDVAAAA